MTWRGLRWSWTRPSLMRERWSEPIIIIIITAASGAKTRSTNRWIEPSARSSHHLQQIQTLSHCLGNEHGSETAAAPTRGSTIHPQRWKGSSDTTLVIATAAMNKATACPPGPADPHRQENPMTQTGLSRELTQLKEVQSFIPQAPAHPAAGVDSSLRRPSRLGLLLPTRLPTPLQSSSTLPSLQGPAPLALVVACQSMMPYSAVALTANLLCLSLVSALTPT